MEKILYNLFFQLEDSHWWFVSTRRYLLSLLEKYRPKHRIRILDAGCGTGGMMLLLQKYGDVEGIDIAEEATHYCRMRGLTNVRQGSLEKLPFRPRTFDMCIAIDVIEHVEHDVLALKELDRVLKPGGIILISVPAHQNLWSTHDVINHHYRRYSEKQLNNLLLHTHFTPLKQHYCGLIALLPLIASVILERLGIGHIQLMFKKFPPAVNTLFRTVYSFDLFFTSLVKPPFGTGIITVARKQLG